MGTFSRHIIIILLHALYTDCPNGRADAVARHVSFAQITCFQLRAHVDSEHKVSGNLHGESHVQQFVWEVTEDVLTQVSM